MKRNIKSYLIFSSLTLVFTPFANVHAEERTNNESDTYLDSDTSINENSEIRKFKVSESFNDTEVVPEEKTLLNTLNYTVIDTKSINYIAKVDKPWSINTQPWGVNGFELVISAEEIIGETVEIVQEKTTERGTYALIKFNGQELGWIDKTGLNTLNILSSRDISYSANVTNPWSINTLPWGTEGYEVVMSAQEIIGEIVEITKEITTDKGTYALISLNGKELGWIDTSGLNQHKVLSSKNINYTATISKPWSINTEPWGIEGYQLVADGTAYLGQTFNIIQEKKTEKSTYVLLEKNGDILGWIDYTGVEVNKDITSVRDTNYVAVIQKPWSINTEPWGTEGAKSVYANSSQFLGDIVTITQEKVTLKSTYALISLNGKELGWIDTTGIEKQRVLSTKNVDYKAEIVAP